MRPLLLLLSLLVFADIKAQSIRGDIVDVDTREPLSGVNILNVHKSHSTQSDTNGSFSILADKGELVEFRKLGFKTVRVRLPQGQIPPYFKIVMQIGPIELQEIELAGGRRNWQKDSLEYNELYRTWLEVPRLTGVEAIRSPFSALSKKNRQIWAFQKEFTWFEQQKYIDYVFNENLVAEITGLSGDSLQFFLRRYRPTYEQLRSMNDYNIYRYIRETGEVFRIGRRRQGYMRNPN